jgi:hypothetical protein
MGLPGTDDLASTSASWAGVPTSRSAVTVFVISGLT